MEKPEDCSHYPVPEPRGNRHHFDCKKCGVQWDEEPPPTLVDGQVFFQQRERLPCEHDLK